MPEWWGDTSLTPTQAAYAFLAPASVGGDDTIDYTFLQLLWDDSPDCTTCPFGGGPARSSTTCSINHSLERSRRSRLLRIQTTTRSSSVCVSGWRDDVMFDFNYTLGHSLDNASGLQSSGSYGAAFIVNASVPGSKLRQLRISMPGTSSMPTGWSDFRLVVASDS